MKSTTTITALLIATGVVSLLSACGDNAGAATDDGVIEVTMTDFTFGDLPDEVPVGTRLQVHNHADTELHEFVAFRLDDGDDRTVEEIVESGLETVLASGPPAAVLLAAPGGEQIAAVGDGALTEPGRYIVLCAIPTGVDPATYLEAAKTSEGPPQVGGGAPHFVHGMVDELIVRPD